ncbi:uncharacterized protein LOC121405377 [Drosophila obscura]|uniref:uncharacterized protein LOC121405377 n=1 Tax=Drosophila obscura TaxID=7282 RepID=UPI001BB218A1|nr:uncharacterized protein LOC121405377 [Drosophila obscura]
MEFGHMARQCRSETDRSKMCRRCGKEDHLAKDCELDPKCMICKGKTGDWRHLNLNHCEAAQALLSQDTKERRPDVVLVCEPYKPVPGSGWIQSKCRKAAIWGVRTPPLDTDVSREGFVRARLSGVTFYSCYAPPSWELPRFQAMLGNIAEDSRGRAPFVIAGDFNAWAVEWGSKETNTRGYCLLEQFSSLDVGLANDGARVTFCRRVGDHQAIHFELGRPNRGRSKPKLTGPKWKDSLLDVASFSDSIRQCEWSPAGNSAEYAARELTQRIVDACNALMPKRKPSLRGTPCYWWTQEIAELRSACLRTRRRAHRARGRQDFENRQAEFRMAKQELKVAIKKSKSDSFRRICDEADVDPWGTAYKVVTKRIRGVSAPTPTCPELLRHIVTALFPRHPQRASQAQEEVTEATRRVGDRKAPGPDGIPNRALKLAVAIRPELFVDAFNS